MTLIANRYELNELLGSGGMGEVYCAKDRLTGATIALKRVLLAPNSLQHTTHIEDRNLDLALAHEFKALASLRHPHIISVLDYGFDENHVPFFTMEFVPDAKSILHAAYQQSADNLIDLLIQLLQGLDYLHRRGLLHRDLKPNNIIVHANQVKIIDFGLAIESEKAQGTGGTVIYIAPEQFVGHVPGIASDLYMVGLIAYQLFLRKYPFNLEQHINKVISDIIGISPDFSGMPEAISPVIEKLLEKDPTQRYASASDTIQAICEAWGRDLPPETLAIRESYLQASTFVGREAELEILSTALDAVTNGASSFFLIGGESGVGKSRLVEELRIQALVQGGQVWQGHGVEGGGLSFQAWRSVARNLVLSVALTAHQASILKGIVPDIEALVQYDVADTDVSGADYQHELSSTLIDLLGQVETPLLIILEDLQWTSESLLPLKHLFTKTEQVSRLMIVGTYRNEEKPNLPSLLPDMQVLTLERLTRQAIHQLSKAMLGDSTQQYKITDFLMQETEGNTFFMVEIVRALAELAGSIGEIGTRTLPDNILTGGIEQLLARRLAKLDPIYHDMINIAAVIGRQINRRLLNYIYPQHELIDQFLFQAELTVILKVQDNTWQFSHDKTREAVLNQLSSASLKQLHSQVALAIEAVYPDDTSYFDMLYYHWKQAGDLDKEAYYLKETLPRMVALIGQYNLARRFTLDILKRLDKDDKRRIPFLYHLSMAYERQGLFIEAETSGCEAYELAKTLQDKTTLVQCLANLAFMNYRLQNFEIAQPLAEESLQLYTEKNDLIGMTATLNTLGVIAMDQQKYDVALEYFERNRLLHAQLGQPTKGLVSLLSNTGTCAMAQGNLELAAQNFEEGLRHAKALGDKWAYANILVEYSFLNLKRNEPFQQQIREAFEIGWEIQAINLCLEGLVAYTIGILRQGDVRRAIHFADFVENHPDKNSYISQRLELFWLEVDTLEDQVILKQVQGNAPSMDLGTVLRVIINNS